MLDISKIQWPIYPLRPYIQIATVGNQKLIEMSDGSTRLLDDSTYSGTLGLRRLQYEASNQLFKYKLFKLTKPIFRFEDLLHHKLTTKFIDSSGRIFNYKKSVFHPLTYHKIEKFTLTKNGYSVSLKGFHCRFFLNREPELEWKWAGVLRIGRGFLLYEFSSDKKPDSRRMI